MIWAIVFWVSVFIILHSYLLFPLILKSLASKKKQNDILFTRDDDLPFISVIMAVHNEEKVITEKVRSIFNTDYPEEKFELLIGSDSSTDKTNDILRVIRDIWVVGNAASLIGLDSVLVNNPIKS